ncbi:alpha-D-ribose 1-methylphosphonate 5-phosphate C-P-lyase PhnJ [Heliorestis acidaminivorans]|uniref:Alpha-D-ribose 1-methylphosphonate 5-phosphate C-P-lyase PhnJ n=1 Tax=Heliorestis acidaminivorans TaxID=553427 RepID=A0A6I0F2B5_9FIRM|nr:alpha-D-ribose 1-methylphosphonate 5-phosphate C-P-lyase PhnJ [Heliorestis acidaminivorans]KAB2953458.1 alpha-D-ribose 1-methylphosphonate 5-phosphate C-P-lyase PhnJ [Heliorestis acidaminivorans]
MKAYNFAFFDEGSKREIRRATVKAISIPGYQVPFASREMPIARGWGTGGLQLTLSLLGQDDIVKVIDQGCDESVNAVNIKKFINKMTGIRETEQTATATIIQSRHRIPEVELRADQILVLQVPIPEPLREVEPSEYITQRLHADQEYSAIWLMLFEQIMKHNKMTTGADHPVLVHQRYVMSPSPIPRYDNCKLHNSKALILLGAGREKKIYAIPPYTTVQSLAFNDYPFQTEDFSGRTCHLCGASAVYFDELIDEESGHKYYQCNDSSYCLQRLNQELL